VSRVLVVLAGLVLALLAPAATAAEPITSTSPPTVSGTPAYRSLLTASPGTWSASAPTYSYRWLRDGTPISGATAATYRPVLADLGTDVAVRVTASQDGESGTATSAPVRIRRAT
jgi:hypothetical protein